jgi:hypothetical protein
MASLRYFTFLVIFTLLSVHGNGQEVTYTSYEKFDNRSDAYSVVGMTGGYLYTYLRNEEGSKLEAYNDSMKNTIGLFSTTHIPGKIHTLP